MKLIKCSIENFGKLKGRTFEFTDGCNTIMEQNGYGKTTLAVFLKAMFYGLANTGKAAITVNERKHYAPWQGGAFGGTLLFEENGKRYLIERFFGEKDKDETFVLYDADTNLISHDYSSKIGEELFFLDREAFEKSIYMPQQSLQTGGNDSLNAKLSNLTDVENDMNHFELAKANLEKKQKELMRTGERGKIWELRHKVSNLERRLKEVDGVFEAAHLWEEKRQQVEGGKKEAKERLALLEEELTYFSKQEQKRAQRVQYQALRENFLKGQERLEKLRTFFPKEMWGNISVYTGLDEYFTAIMKKSECATRLSVLEADRQRLEKEKKQQQELVLKLKLAYMENETENVIESKKSILPFLGAVALTLSGIFLFTIQKTVGIGFVLAGGLLSGLSVKELQKKAYFEKRVLKSKQEHRKELLERLSEAEKNSAEVDAGFLACEEEMAKTSRAWHREQEKLAVFLGQFVVYDNIEENEYMMALSEIKEKAAVYLSVMEEVLECQRCINQFEMENPYLLLERNEVKKEADRTLEVIQREQNEWYRKLQNLTEEESQIQRQLDIFTVQLEQGGEIRSELAHERERLKECENKYDLLGKTIKYLEKAKELFQTRYLTKLRESFQKYMEILNHEILGETVIDAKLKCKVTKGGKKKEVDYFSAGYRDLMNLCLRFAMIEALYEKEKPFLILDDPFVNMDEEKTKQALAFLKRLSKEYQIIYFTCHGSRRE